MSLGTKGRKRVWRRRLLLGGLVCSAVLALFYGGAIWLSHRAVRHAEQAWDEAHLTLGGLVARYPHRDRNGTARNAEIASAALGIDLAPRWDESGPHPEAEARQGYAAVREPLGSYLQRTLEIEDSSIPPPPAEVAAFLEGHARQLDRLRDGLEAGQPPFWLRELEEGVNARLPNLLGQIDLQRLLLADALLQTREGHREAARADLETSWRLAGALGQDPILIVQLIHTAVGRYQAGVLRHVPVDPGVWDERLESLRDTSVFLDSFRFEVAAFSELDPTQLLPHMTWWENVAGRIAAPYLRFCAASDLNRWRRAIEQLEKRRSLCPSSDETALNWKLPERPWWNYLTESSLPNVLATADRVGSLQVDLELTRRWLALSAARDESGAWPARLPLPEASRACPGERWSYSQTTGGAAEIHFSREFAWPQAGVKLPLRLSTAPSL